MQGDIFLLALHCSLRWQNLDQNGWSRTHPMKECPKSRPIPNQRSKARLKKIDFVWDRISGKVKKGLLTVQGQNLYAHLFWYLISSHTYHKTLHFSGVSHWRLNVFLSSFSFYTKILNSTSMLNKCFLRTILTLLLK